jgi:hypothetical protein
MVGRSYGALSNTGTYSAASLGICDDTIFLERYTPASGGGDGLDPETGHQVGSNEHIIIVILALFNIHVLLFIRENISSFRIRNPPCLPDCVLASFTLHPPDRP